ncbi:MAG: HDIG domain-containing protein [Chloroflexi bacterium]|nr:HDIG domain-containing protein [Chloroflexota bacterium]
MDREVAVGSIQARVRNANLIKHMLATEAIMAALARRLGQDEQEWGLTGLLHDIDVELTGQDPRQHSRVGAELAREMGASESMCHAILCHNEAHGIACETLLDRALFCVDPLTGLITAGALIRPEKSLAGLTGESLMKRFKEKRFAAGANREAIASCQQIGLGLDEFVSLGLEAMKGIAADLGL